MQMVIENDRLTDRQLTRALTALGAETTVNAKQVHRQRLLAARRTQGPEETKSHDECVVQPVVFSISHPAPGPYTTQRHTSPQLHLGLYTHNTTTKHRAGTADGEGT